MYLLEPKRTSFLWMDMVISNHFSHGKDFWFIHPIDSQPFIIWMFQVPGKNQYHSITLNNDKNGVSLKDKLRVPQKDNSANRSVEFLKFL